jgi:ABC-type glycerol-3-phosphate transport system permease component
VSASSISRPAPAGLARRLTRARIGFLLVTYGSALVLMAVCALPLIWMLSTSLKPSQEILDWPPRFIPATPSFEHFAKLFTSTMFPTHFYNSVYTAFWATVVSVALGAMAGYGLTRYRFWGRELIANSILLTYLFPQILIFIPLYIVFRILNLNNTHLALILSYVSFSLPFATWLLRAFFESIPLELEEAAMVDGANRLKAVIYIIAPMALPGIIATSIFTFIVAWNDFLFARIFVTSENLKTLPVGIQDFFSMAVIDWGLIMAAGMMVTIPALIFFVSVQSFLVKGWGAGAVKG